MSAPVREGDVLAGKYRVERVLGQGGMGVVVSARHVQLGQHVALKFLLPAAYGSPDAVARFLREAQAAVQIRSEHVARILDVGTLETGAPFMVMEFLSGEDLAAVLQARGSLPVDEAVTYVLQACEALAEAHAAGIVHRDLKPSNLFLTRRADGSALVKVLDFGISKGIAPPEGGAADLTATSAVMGSPAYMSPEQIRSSKHVDARADVWALGVVIHQLVSGRLPFESTTLTEMMAKVVADPPTPLRFAQPSAPPELERVVLMCLEKDANRRLRSVGALAQALGPFATASARVSIERIVRVLGEVPGTMVAPEGASSGPVGTVVATGSSWPGGLPPQQTGGGWGTTGAKTSSKSPLPLILGVSGGALAVLGLGAFLMLRAATAPAPGAPAPSATAAATAVPSSAPASTHALAPLPEPAPAPAEAVTADASAPAKAEPGEPPPAPVAHAPAPAAHAAPPAHRASPAPGKPSATDDLFNDTK